MRPSRALVATALVVSTAVSCDSEPPEVGPRPTTSLMPTPSTPSPEPAVSPADAIGSFIARRSTKLVQLLVAPDGGMLAVYESPDFDYAVAVRDADAVQHLRWADRHVEDISAPAGPGLWQLTRGRIIDDDGVLVPTTRARLRPEPGDVVVSYPDQLFRHSTAMVSRLPRDGSEPFRSGAVVTDDGSLVGVLDSNADIYLARLGLRGTTVKAMGAEPDMVAGGIAFSGDVVGVELIRRVTTPNTTAAFVTGLAVSEDAGRHWRTVPLDNTDRFSTIAVTSSGAVLVGTQSSLYRLRPGGDEVDVLPHRLGDYLVGSAGADVYRSRDERLERSTDDGDTWTVAALPGR